MNLKNLNGIIQNFSSIGNSYNIKELNIEINKLIKFKENYIKEFNDISNNEYFKKYSCKIMNDTLKYINEDDNLNITFNSDNNNFLAENRKLIEEINQNFKKDKNLDFIKNLNSQIKDYKIKWIDSQKIMIDLNNINIKLRQKLNNYDDIIDKLKNVDNFYDKKINELDNTYENILSEEELYDNKEIKKKEKNGEILNKDIRNTFREINLRIKKNNKIKEKNYKEKYINFTKDSNLVFKIIIKIITNLNTNIKINKNFSIEEIIDNIVSEINNIKLTNFYIFENFFDKFTNNITILLENIKYSNNFNSFNIIKNIINLVKQGNFLKDIFKEKIQVIFNKFENLNYLKQSKEISYLIDLINDFITKNINVKIENKHLRKVQTLHLEYKDEINKLKNNKELKIIINNYDKIINYIIKNNKKNDEILKNDYKIEEIDIYFKDWLSEELNLFKKEIKDKINIESEDISNNYISNNTLDFDFYKDNYLNKILVLIKLTNNYKEKIFYLIFSCLLKINIIFNENLSNYKKNENKLKLWFMKLKNLKKIFFYFNEFCIDIDLNYILSNIENVDLIYKNIIKEYEKKLEINVNNEKWSLKSNLTIYNFKYNVYHLIPFIIDNNLLFVNFKLVINKN